MSLHIPSPASGTGLETSRKPTHLQALHSPLPYSLAELPSHQLLPPLVHSLPPGLPFFLCIRHSLLALCPVLSHKNALSFSTCPDPQAAVGFSPGLHCPPPRCSPALHHHLQSDTPEGRPTWAGLEQQPNLDSLQPDWRWFLGLLTVHQWFRLTTWPFTPHMASLSSSP